jgi:transcriptional regulator with GAF, ATPase, and Fis domain
MRHEFRGALLAAAVVSSGRDVCHVLATNLARPTTVLARFWLRRGEHQLQLEGSAGFATGGGFYNRIDGEFSRLDIRHGKIGQIAASGEPLVVRGIRGDEDWLANPGWISRQGVRAFIGLPLVSPAGVVGVMAMFERAMPSDEDLEDLRFIADFAAVRLTDIASRSALVAPRPSIAATAARGVESIDPAAGPRVLTRTQMRAREKANIEAALSITQGRVFGDDGAAKLLEMRPTTLASRMKALGVTRFRGPAEPT